MFIFVCSLAMLILSFKMMAKNPPVKESREQVDDYQRELERDVMMWNNEYYKEFKDIQIKVILDNDLYFKNQEHIK